MAKSAALTTPTINTGNPNTPPPNIDQAYQSWLRIEKLRTKEERFAAYFMNLSAYAGRQIREETNAGQGTAPKHRLSAEGKKRIAEAQKRRRAQEQGTQSATATQQQRAKKGPQKAKVMTAGAGGQE